jgi:flagellar basal-body rod protein FlgC
VDYSNAVRISAAGMMAQKTRIEAATLNLANMNVSAAPGTAGFRPLTAVIHAQATRFSMAFGARSWPIAVARAELVPQAGTTTRSVYEPGHPDADAAGMVSYPMVDSTQEMMTAMTALRAYEANLEALQISRTMAARALDIGSAS